MISQQSQVSIYQFLNTRVEVLEQMPNGAFYLLLASMMLLIASHFLLKTKYDSVNT